VVEFLVSDRAGSASCIRVIGEVDLAVRDDLVATVRTHLATAGDVELDCAEVTFIDSSGLGALVLLNKEARQAEKRLVLANPSAAMDRLFTITGLRAALDIRAHE
jgi:anti-anti-sigma factor